jgi:phage tail-like protein
MHFEEVSGLDAEAQPIEYRHGDSPRFSTVKMPGIRKFGDVTLKKGTLVIGDDKLLEWFDGIRSNTAEHKALTISLLDEAGRPTVTWTLANARPVKITGTDLKATGNEVALETLVVSHEGLSVANG